MDVSTIYIIRCKFRFILFYEFLSVSDVHSRIDAAKVQQIVVLSAILDENLCQQQCKRSRLPPFTHFNAKSEGSDKLLANLRNFERFKCEEKINHYSGCLLLGVS
jgi:hypothetical protein